MSQAFQRHSRHKYCKSNWICKGNTRDRQAVLDLGIDRRGDRPEGQCRACSSWVSTCDDARDRTKSLSERWAFLHFFQRTHNSRSRALIVNSSAPWTNAEPNRAMGRYDAGIAVRWNNVKQPIARGSGPSRSEKRSSNCDLWSICTLKTFCWTLRSV